MTVPSYLAFTVISVLSLALAVSSLTLAQDPTREPPLDNVAPPLNTSSSPQNKSGGLSVGSLIVGGSEGGLRVSPGGIVFPEIVYTSTEGITSSSTGFLSRGAFESNTVKRSSSTGEILGTNSLQLKRYGFPFGLHLISDESGESLQFRNEARYGLRNIVLSETRENSEDGLVFLRSVSLSPQSLSFSSRQIPVGHTISSNARTFEIKLNTQFSEQQNADIDTVLGIRRGRNTDFSRPSIFYMISANTKVEALRYEARLGINTENPRYPLDVSTFSNTTEPWVAGFGYESLVKIGADGRVAAREYCDSEGNNCFTAPPICTGSGKNLGWNGSSWTCNDIPVNTPNDL